MAVLFLFSCEEQENRNSYTNLKFGHRGSGTNIYQGCLVENTLPSIAFAFSKLDGCEVDIQMSKDGTIWVYHDDIIGYYCDTLLTLNQCIPQSSDAFIREVKQCHDSIRTRIFTLQEVFELLSLPEYSSKFISLDVKGYFDSICFPYRNAPTEYFHEIGEELLRLSFLYGVEEQLIVETSYLDFLTYIKERNKNIKCHLLGYEDFLAVADKAIANNLDGVSFSLYDSSFDKSHVDQAKEMGLKVQVWPIKNKEMLKKAIEFKPFAMQGDLDAFLD